MHRCLPAGSPCAPDRSAAPACGTRTTLVLGGAIAAPARANTDDDIARWVEKGTLVVGVVFGDPTGVAAKWYLKDDQAVQAALGSAFIGGG